MNNAIELLDTLSFDELKTTFNEMLHILEEKVSEFSEISDIDNHLLMENEKLKEELEGLKSDDMGFNQNDVLEEENKIGRLRNDIEGLKREMSNVSNENVSVQLRLKDLNVQYSTVSMQRDSVESTLEDHVNELNEIEEKVEFLGNSSSVTNLRELVEKQKERIETLKKEKKENEKIIDDNNAEIEEIESIIEESDMTVEAESDEVKEVEPTPEEIDVEILKEIETKKSVLIDQKLTHEQTVLDYNNRIKALKAELKASRNNLMTTQEELEISPEIPSITVEEAEKFDDYTTLLGVSPDPSATIATTTTIIKKKKKSKGTHRRSRTDGLKAELTSLRQALENIDVDVVDEKPWEDIEGILAKRGRWVKSWKKRFFFFESDCLYYSESQEQRYSVKGSIRLIDAVCMDSEIDDKPLAFSVSLNGRNLYMTATSKQEKRMWMENINKAIEYYSHKDFTFL